MQRKHVLTGLAAWSLVASALAAAPLPAQAQTRDLGRMSDYIKLAQDDTSGTVVKNRWLVQVAGSPVADGGTASTVANAQASVVKGAAARGVRIKGQRSYSRTFNGMAVTLDAKQVSTLAQVPGVTGVYPVVEVSRPVTGVDKGSDEKIANAVGMSGVGIARDDLGYTGKGVKVGIIDSGIDIDHPDLGGKGTNGSTPFPTKRVKWGYDFVGDAYDSKNDASVPVPDAVPDDCGGHGTHVAGIIGANGNPAKGGVVGVAPQVSFGAYRVFGCEGSTSSEIIMAALDRAEADGMDVVNMSLGADMMTWSDYPTAQATDALARKGIIVVTSAGNSGDKGAFSSGAPSVGHRTISVASYDNVASTMNAFAMDDTNQKVGYLPATGAPLPAADTSLWMMAIGAPGTTEAQGCTPYTDAQKALFREGAAALVQRGTCTFREKALNAQAAGAKAVVIYNNQPGSVNPTVEGDPALTIPVLMISQADGEQIYANLGKGNRFRFITETVSNPVPTAGQISDFSSWGVGADLTLKPDLGAPGGNIWSTYPLEKGGHASLSGTSMASPHVTGAVALMLQANPKLKGHPADVLRLLQNTAVHDAPFRFNTKLGLPEMVIRQGAGMIQVDRAILTEQSISPSKLSLGDDQSKSHTTTLTLRNQGRKAAVYTLANQTSIGSLGTSDPQFDLLDANVTMPSKVVVPAHGSVKVTVTITAPTDAPNGYLYGGWIVATSPTATTLNVPYLGMAGDYQRVPVLTAPGFSGPCLAGVTDGTASCLSATAGLSYSMAQGDQPIALFHLEYPTEKALVEVYRAKADGTKGALLGTALDLEKDGRELGDLTFAWDGTYMTPGKHSYKAKASAGSYLLEVRALRALGKAGNAADWDTWTSPAFTATFAARAAAANANGVVVNPDVLHTTQG